MMSKKVLAPSLALALMMMGAGAASADDGEVVVPIGDMPLSDGIVVDVSDVEGEPEDVSGIDEIPEGGVDTTPDPGEGDINEDTTTNDGIDLPLDQGDLDAGDIDTGDDSNLPEETVEPRDDNLILTDKEPEVEKLAQTGIEESKLLLVLGTLLGAVGIIFTRKRKALNN